MKSIRVAFGSMLFLATLAVASQAQVQRTFVSGLGNDNNPCNRAAPCRTFGQAIMGTSAGGEVYVLDTAGYGPFVVTKAITINAPHGVIAGISVFSENGIDINAGADDVVILRGLTINWQGGNHGIVFNSGARLNIEGCVVNGFRNGAGIWIRSPSTVVVNDTIARGNNVGIAVQPATPGTAFVAMDGLHVDGNDQGISVEGGIAGVGVNAAIRNSSVTRNFEGMLAGAVGSGAFAFLDIESCLATNNLTGLVTSGSQGGSAALSISNCTISHNSGHGFFMSGGAILSRGNNTILGNGPSTGSLTPLAAQ